VSRHASALYFFLAFTGLTLAIHLPYLTLPFFWDELGQFVPAALDLYHDGAWIPHSAAPNVHPPGVMALLALVWRAVGFSIMATRLTMLLLASAGTLFSFLLVSPQSQVLRPEAHTCFHKLNKEFFNRLSPCLLKKSK